VPPTRETRVFDPADGFSPLTNVVELTDATLTFRDGRWWMYLAGQDASSPSTHLFSACLPHSAPLFASGWTITPDPRDSSKIALLSGNDRSRTWDLSGGRHCPAYVKGWNPQRREWVERIYYAGSSDRLWGPYAIGFLEWDGTSWIDQPAPFFVASELWEKGSVYEPNLLFHDGKWKLWYVAGSNLDDYLIHGYAESEDGIRWSKHLPFAAPELKLFDFAVIPHRNHFEAVFSRVHLTQSAPPPTTGLWWCRSDSPSPRLSEWSSLTQIMTAADQGWHSGPWRPCPFPFAFTVGCLELPTPHQP